MKGTKEIKTWTHIPLQEQGLMASKIYSVPAIHPIKETSTLPQGIYFFLQMNEKDSIYMNMVKLAYRNSNPLPYVKLPWDLIAL